MWPDRDAADALQERLRVRDGEVYPPAAMVLRALDLAPLASVRVVIVGQDPYHGEGQAMGLAFSVSAGVPPPPSLRNIIREVRDDVGQLCPADLTPWARQGVLLLNRVLTVLPGRAGSHRGEGWEEWSAAVIERVSRQRHGVAFLLWGAHAGALAPRIDAARHLVLTAPHPSPLSAHRGFLGCRHFSRVNAHLAAKGSVPIRWGDPL